MRKILSILVVLLMLHFPCIGVNELGIYAKNKVVEIPKNLRGIDFSKPLSKKDQRRVIRFYNKESDRIFTKKNIKKRYNCDKKRLTREGYKEEKKILVKRGRGPLGKPGDILIKYTGRRAGTFDFRPGHTGIVHTNRYKTVESFPKFNSRKDGVRKYENTWRGRANTIGIKVSRTSKRAKYRAARYAVRQIGKHYNWNVFNKYTQEKFYCSQLVWRAWLSQGVDLDRRNLGKYDPVTPGEIYMARRAYVFAVY